LSHERLVNHWLAVQDKAQRYRDWAAGPAETVLPDGTLVQHGNQFRFDTDLAGEELAAFERQMELTAARITEQRTRSAKPG
jgi:hypothetical protein